MIARVWRGLIAADRQAEYVAYMDATGVGEYRQAEGCRVSMILTRALDAGRVEVSAFSVWDSEEAIQGFAGPDIDAMVLYAEDEDFLLETPTLVHHEVHSFDVPAVRSGGSD